MIGKLDHLEHGPRRLLPFIRFGIRFVSSGGPWLPSATTLHLYDEHKLGKRWLAYVHSVR
jgi:hypothetical protein